MARKQQRSSPLCWGSICWSDLVCFIRRARSRNKNKTRKRKRRGREGIAEWDGKKIKVKGVPLVCEARWRGRCRLSPPLSVSRLGSSSLLPPFPWLLRQERKHLLRNTEFFKEWKHFVWDICGQVALSFLDHKINIYVFLFIKRFVPTGVLSPQ